MYRILHHAADTSTHCCDDMLPNIKLEIREEIKKKACGFTFSPLGCTVSAVGSAVSPRVCTGSAIGSAVSTRAVQVVL
jgi:hypothetical protein